MTKKVLIILISLFILLPIKIHAFWCGDGNADYWCENKVYPGSCGHSGCGSCSGPDLHVNQGANGPCCSWWCIAECPSNITETCTSTCSACGNSKTCEANETPPSGQCDSTCINQCGYRNADGSCTTDNACCHRVCTSSGSCTTIAGAGANECDNDGNCGSDDEDTPQPPGCNPYNLEMSYTPSPGRIGETMYFNMDGYNEEGSVFRDDSFNGGVSNCYNGWPTTRCIASSGGDFTWTHYWRTCVGDFEHCSDQCSKTLNFTIGIPTPTPIPIPNCKNLTGPTTIDYGGTYSYTYTAEGIVTRTSLGSYRSSCSTWSADRDVAGVGTSGVNQFNYTPILPGTFTLFGRVWNDGIAECRGQCVDGPPRYPCIGPSCSLTVNVRDSGFNVTVLDPDENSWGPGNDCNNYQGVGITTSVGIANWRTNYFEVGTVPSNRTVTVTLSPPEGCRYTCDRWQTTSGGYSGTGCTATFQSLPPSGSRNVIFYLKPNCSPSCSAPFCGQDDNCFGTCSTADTRSPAATTIVSPNGTSSFPTAYLSTSTINFIWNQSNDPVTDGYSLIIHDENNNRIITQTINRNNITSTTLPATSYFSAGHIYRWQIQTYNDTCRSYDYSTMYSPWSSPGYFKVNSPPTISAFTLRNSGNTAIAPESVVGIGSSVNQICDSRFGDSRTVIFTVQANDVDGFNDISNIQLRLGGNRIINPDSITNGLARFTVSDLPNSTTLYSIEAQAIDRSSQPSPWVNSGRLLKMWNCLVPVRGTLFNASGTITCTASSSAFLNPAENSHWTALHLMDVTGSSDKIMNVTPPTYTNSTNNELEYNHSYGYSFNADLNGPRPQMRIPNSSVCQSSFSVNNTTVNPYSNSPSIQIDFSTIINSPPIVTGFDLKNVNNNSVPSENVAGVGSSVNHICDPRFLDSRTIKIGVTAVDVDGLSDVNTIQLRIGGNRTYSPDSPVVNGQATFTISDLTDSTTFYTIEAIATDQRGASSPMTNSGRLFKMWNCLVPIHGTLYNGSDAVFGTIQCTPTSNDFTNPASELNWTSLRFQYAGEIKNMQVNSPTYTNQANQELKFGATYLYSFNADLAASTPQMRIPNSSTCRNSLPVDNTTTNPYSNSPELQVDFSSIIDQEPWFQVTGGGINAVNQIRDSIPITCQHESDCTPAISIENTSIGFNNNGLVYGSSIDYGCDNCKFGNPNNWGRSANRYSLSENFNYNYFFKDYDDKFRQVKYYDHNMDFDLIKTDTGGTGVVIVDGDVNINTDNTLTGNQFLMIIAHRNINIYSTVNNISGIFFADGSITAAGESDTQLIINGALYSVYSNISLTRGFQTKNFNNSRPAVKINFLPHLIFTIPNTAPEINKTFKLGS